MEMKDFFSLVHEHNAWGSPESRSGAGSTLEATKHVRRELPLLIQRYGIRSVLDLPCGDFNWMKTLVGGEFSYIGADIVEPLIETNRKNHPGIDFRLLDLVTSDLPKVDLVLCRDCFIHFPIESTKKALSNIKRSGSTFVLTTNYLWRHQANANIPLGKFTRVNFQEPPYSMVTPRDIIPEGNSEREPYIGVQHDRVLALWAVNDIPNF